MRLTVAHRDLVTGLESLGINPGVPVIVHSSLSSFGHVVGGAKAVVDALLALFGRIMSPTFTYQTMITPEQGPPGNGLGYSPGATANRTARCWAPDLPSDPLMGAISEGVRNHRKSRRSDHPILSFSGIGVERLLAAQNRENPFGPLAALSEDGGWVLLLGVDHSVNTTLHYAEQIAGRKTFLRWALTIEGTLDCPNFPGCSNGFMELEGLLLPVTRTARIGRALVRALPAAEMVSIAAAAFKAQPRGYLCRRMDCGRCNEIRMNV